MNRHRRAEDRWLHGWLTNQGKEPSVMTCLECGSHPHDSAAFCTECGAELPAGQEADVPLSIGSWTPESAHLSDRTTAPILGVRSSGSADNAPAEPSPEPEAHRPTPVKEMVGSERAEWIGRVWCSAAGVAR